MTPPALLQPELPWSVAQPGKMVCVPFPESVPKLSLKSSNTERPAVWTL